MAVTLTEAVKPDVPDDFKTYREFLEYIQELLGNHKPDGEIIKWRKDNASRL